jgi:serine/threonine-protein kinase
MGSSSRPTTRGDQLVAIKLLLPEALEDPEAGARFEREARVAAKIKGQHIARFMDVETLESGSCRRPRSPR